MKAQGATEYLVLLAVVLIVALVSVALLGFFPGMASDAQVAQSQMYWRSATPIAITEAGARALQQNAITYPYFRLRNNGNYPIRITAIIDSENNAQTVFGSTGSCGMPSGSLNFSDYYYMAPGDENYIGFDSPYGLPCNKWINVYYEANWGYASSVCQNSSSSPGTLIIENFGFRYIEYVEGQQITKRQIGAKPLIVKCGPPY
jgi:hypothetical protein